MSGAGADGADGAQLLSDVAQLLANVAQLLSDIAQLHADVAQLLSVGYRAKLVHVGQQTPGAIWCQRNSIVALLAQGRHL